MLFHHNARVNSHQRWKQTRFRICFHLWHELTLVLWCHSIVWSLFFLNYNAIEWQISWNSCWPLSRCLNGLSCGLSLTVFDRLSQAVFFCSNMSSDVSSSAPIKCVLYELSCNLSPTVLNRLSLAILLYFNFFYLFRIYFTRVFCLLSIFIVYCLGATDLKLSQVWTPTFRPAL